MAPHPTLFTPRVATELGDVLYSLGILLLLFALQMRKVQGLSRKSLGVFAGSVLIQQFSLLPSASKGTMRLFQFFQGFSMESLLRLSKDAPDAFLLLTMAVRIMAVVGILNLLRKSEAWKTEGVSRDRGQVWRIVLVSLMAAFLIEYKAGFDIEETLRLMKWKALIPLIVTAAGFVQSLSLVLQIEFDEQGVVKRDAVADFALCLLSAPSLAFIYGHVVAGVSLPTVLISKKTLPGIFSFLTVVVSTPFWIKLVQRRFIISAILGLVVVIIAASLSFQRVTSAAHLCVLFLTPFMSGILGMQVGFICLLYCADRQSLLQYPPALRKFFGL